MVNKYYQPGEQRAAKVADLFATIAPRYDLVNDLQSFGLHRYWKRRLVRLAAPRPGERALDICCGTGDIAFALARHRAESSGWTSASRCWRWQERKAESKVQSPKPYQIVNRKSQITNLKFPSSFMAMRNRFHFLTITSRS